MLLRPQHLTQNFNILKFYFNIALDYISLDSNASYTSSPYDNDFYIILTVLASTLSTGSKPFDFEGSIYYPSTLKILLDYTTRLTGRYLVILYI